MQALAESLGPLDARTPRAARRCATWIGAFADLYEHYGPVIRAWTEAEIGSDEFGRLGTDVLTRVHPRARPTASRAAAPPDLDPVVAALALVAMLERLQLLRARRARCASSRDADGRHARARHARRAVRRVDPGAQASVGSGSPARTRAWRSPSSATGPEYATSPFDEHDRVVGDRERVVHVLLDDEQRRARVADRRERAVHLVDDDRREPERELVGDQQARLLDEHARERRACAARRPRACRRAACAAPRAAGTARTPRRARRRTPRAPATAPERRARGSPRPSATRTPTGPRARARCRAARTRYGASAGDVVAVEAAPRRSSARRARSTRGRSSSCPRRSSRAARAPCPAAARTRRRTARGTARSRRRRRASSSSGAVAGLGRGGRGHQTRSPRYALRTAASANTSSVGPDAISVPKSSTNTRVDEAAHELDVVLDEQDRGAALALHLAQRLARASAVSSRSRPDDGSSSSSSLRLGHQRPADLDEPADAEAQRLDRAVGDGVEAEQLEHRRRRARCSSAVGRPRLSDVLPEARPCPLRARSATRRWSRGVIPANSSMRWNVRPMPEAGPPVRRHAREVRAVERDRPAVGPQQAEQAVEERRLARAVRPDETDDLALADVEATRRRAR